MNYQGIREKVLAASLKANQLGLIHGTSGNVSMCDAQRDAIAITPSGIPYETLRPEDITVVDFKGNTLEGTYKPSSETPMHTAIYRSRVDVMAVVHTHSLFATVMSMTLEDLKRATVPSCMYYPIPVAPFQMPGSEDLARMAAQTLGAQHDVVLLQNHGLLATGNSMEKAMECAIYTEECAQVAYYAELLRTQNYIPEKAALMIHSVAKGGSAV